jgi:epoxyqueuosine reductase
MSPADKSKLVKSIATASGFDAVGVTRPLQSRRAQYYRQWLKDGHAGSMKYLHENADLRENPVGLLPAAKSVVCVALNYKRRDDSTLGDLAGPSGRVAQYARGLDYHRIMRGMLDDVLSRFRATVSEPFEARICVDTAPVLERDLAAAAGLGWIGKNTMVLNRQIGSFFFLGELFVTLELAPDRPQTDHCGACTRCLDACPTGAFPNAYEMDASRCVSYLTIEHRGAIPGELAVGVGDWVYGCDICQDVCPFNRATPPASHPGVTEDRVAARLPLLDLLELKSSAYRRLTKGTAMSRASRKMLKRNAALVLRNVSK